MVTPKTIPADRKESTPASIRDTLFGDLPLDQWPGHGGSVDAFPWSAFASARSHLAAGKKGNAIAAWQQIVAHPGLEPRHYLQAWQFLRDQGQQPPAAVAKQVLGVVIEVAMPQGLDLLAAYPDYSARYHNFSGSGVVWEHPDDSLNGEIDQLLEVARAVVDRIGPWDGARPAAPVGDVVRLCFLTPSGLHFGQGPMGVLGRDPMGGKVIHFATVLMQALIAKQTR